MTFGPDRVRQWSEELARDPGSAVFFPLATAYREQGWHSAALRLCVRGLERNPEHVDAHVLLGQLYRDAGDRTRAADEWAIALRLDPAHPAARRELEALLEKNESPVEAGAAEPVTPALTAAAAEFQAHAAEPGLAGAVLADARGSVLVGRTQWGGEKHVADALHGLAEEMRNAARELGLGEWEAALLETNQAAVHLAPVGDRLLIAATDPALATGASRRAADRLRRAVTPPHGGGEGA